MAIEAGRFFGKDISGYVSLTTRSRGTGIAVSISAVGLGTLVAQLRQAGLKVLPEAGRIVRKEADAILTLAQSHYVPVDTGALHDSGEARGPVYPGGRYAQAEVSFGPSAAERRARGGHSGSEYAVPVHEIDMAHQVGSWKYLEIPANLHWLDFDERAMDDIYEWFTRTVTSDF